MSSVCVYADGDLQFKDIYSTDWFYTYVNEAYNNGFITGVTEDEFAPDDFITRGMIVSIIYKMENEPRAIYAEDFSDITNDYLFANAVRWANANGIVNGISETNFAPNEYITREQLAAIIYRYADSRLKDTQTDGVISFNDKNDISEYAIKAMGYAEDKGILKGDENGNANPKSNVTRAEATAILMRMYASI